MARVNLETSTRRGRIFGVRQKLCLMNGGKQKGGLEPAFPVERR